jgi:hypothetical protein
MIATVRRSCWELWLGRRRLRNDNFFKKNVSNLRRDLKVWPENVDWASGALTRAVAVLGIPDTRKAVRGTLKKK